MMWNVWTNESPETAQASYLAQQQATVTILTQRLDYGDIDLETYHRKMEDLSRSSGAVYNPAAGQAILDGELSIPDYVANLGDLENWESAGWNQFGTAIVDNVKNLPGDVGKAIGTAAGAVTQGAGKGLFGSLGTAGWFLLIGAVVVWAFTWGPLKGWRVAK